MHLIKLSATDSTNAYLKRLCTDQQLPDYSMVWALNQTAGRGQPGRKWDSDPGKNLTFSILKRFEALPVQDQFLINMWVSLAIYDVLCGLEVPDVAIKWPNDIMSGGRKLCGILPENSLKGGMVARSVIGIGLNVNQSRFEDLPHATSIKMTTGQSLELEPLILACRKALISICEAPDAFDYEAQRRRYEDKLFKKDYTTRFTVDGASISGMILGVDREGQLILKMDGGGSRTFGFREIQMQY